MLPQTVEKMFASNLNQVNYTHILTDVQCFSSDIFGDKMTFKNAKSIFDGCYNLVLDSIKTDDLLKFWDNKNSQVTDCYKGCQKLYNQLNNNKKWNDEYLQYFGSVG